MDFIHNFSMQEAGLLPVAPAEEVVKVEEPLAQAPAVVEGSGNEDRRAAGDHSQLHTAKKGAVKKRKALIGGSRTKTGRPLAPPTTPLLDTAGGNHLMEGVAGAVEAGQGPAEGEGGGEKLEEEHIDVVDDTVEAGEKMEEGEGGLDSSVQPAAVHHPAPAVPSQQPALPDSQHRQAISGTERVTTVSCF